ncbi:metallophosphoesterase [Corynebacterium sp. CNJ-954]|uniref:metallophosphoesterase family protein n=1 Tax=Corynebacterium sp. CNJ-954 TaxID=1904962 RepID=UPI00096A4C85|nr:metallophosphoesterase [Corynebacterium sp. CNJ-954]
MLNPDTVDNHDPVTPDPNLIAFIGDIHRKDIALETTVALALEAGATTIIQCGDYWLYGDEVPPQPPGHPDMAQKAQTAIEQACHDTGIPTDLVDVRFIDGNHDNPNLLNPDTPHPIRISDNVTYMPRGTRARLAGVEILFLGGASSIDKQWRTEGLNWWPAENITESQADRAIAAATDPDQPPVDILVTHETTTEAFTALAHGSEHAQDKAGEPAGETNRAHLTGVRDAASPRVHVHGHHHTRFAAPVAGVLDISLNKETRDGSVAILDTTDWSWTIAVERFTYTYPNDDLTQVPTSHRHVEYQGLFEWDTIELPAPEVNLEGYAGQVDPSTVESITAHRMTLQRIRGRGYRLGEGRKAVARNEITAAAKHLTAGKPEAEPDPEHTETAEQLTRWIATEDIDTLTTHLLDPRPAFYIYRHLSPIIELWGTEEARLWAAHTAVNHPAGTPHLPDSHDSDDIAETPAEQFARFADEFVTEHADLMNRLRDA